MVDVIIAVAAKVAELLVVPIGKHIFYPFKYKSNMEELKKQVTKLTNAKERVQHSVNEAKRQGDEIENDVQDWLNRVDEFTDGVVKPIIDDQVKAGKLCSICFCPNLMARYSLSRKAAKTTEKGVHLLGNGTFQKVSYRPPLQKTTSIYVRGHEDFDSRTPVFNDLMKAVTDTDVNLIGVYGMGGVGKTTLVKRVVAQVENDKLFDEVVMVEVTQAPDIKNIQGQIADKLGLIFKEETLPGRAARLRERMKKENRILVILDNVWAKLDLDSIGIPSRGEEKVSIMQKVDHEGENANKRQCKLLLTSRSQDVLRDDMDTQKNFSVEILSDAEAESLFWKIVGYSEEKSDLKPIAVEIVGKCAGLPVAIETIANALKNKSLHFWKDALDLLKKANPKDIQGMNKNVYSTLELSFKFLESDEAKSLFLLCSLCNTGYGINISDLLKYSMGLGLFQDANYTLEKGRTKLHVLIQNLKTSCLLMDHDNDSDLVKMHDIIHAVAISIASTTKLWHNLQDSSDLEKKLPKDLAAVSILYRDIYKLPERMEFPKLELFVLYMENDSSLQVPDAVFEGMKGLKVLAMSGIHLLSPPSSLCCLINLQTLCLDRCRLEDVSIIGELKELEILSFSGSDIEQLSGEIGRLSRLRLLDLSDCSKLKVIKPNVISSLTCLEELYMGNSFVQWDVEGQSNASLAELKQLSRLTALDVHVLNAEIIPQDLSFGKLERYRIFIGDVWDWSGKSETSKTLKLKLSSSIYLRHEIKSLLNRTEDVYLDKLKGVKNVVYELNREGFQQLKHLHVQNGAEILYIANSIEWGLCNVFPRLESLFLDKLINLEKICHGQLAAMSFNKLQIMKVSKCDRLKHLFPFSMANKLLQLQEIEVADCKKLEEIILKESEELIQVESTERIEFTQLRTLTLECLPRLTSFGFNTFTPDIGSQEIVAEDESGGFMSLFSQNVVLPRLENLKLSSITVQSKWLDQFPVMSSCCQALTNLTLKECNGLKFLFSYSVVQSLVLLQKLEILNCKSIEGIINTEELRGEGKTIKMVFPKLYHLRLQHLPKLTSFCKFVGNLIELPSLAELLIENCPKMHAFVSNSPHADTVASKEEQMNLEKNLHSHEQPLFDKRVQVPNLKYLRIDKMDNMRKIWHHQLTPDSFSKIDYFGVFDCHNLLNVFPSNMLRRLQKLDTLVVSNCKSVEVIFEELDISSCMVEENVVKEDVKAVPKLVFPQLTLLKLVDLPRLRVLYPGLYISEWPMLKTLRIWGCKKVEKLTSEFQSLQENHGETQHQNFSIQQPLFIVDKVAFPNLETLSLEWNYIAKELMNENFSGNSCKLKDLQLIDASKEAAFCLCFCLYSLPNLEKLRVTDGVLEEMFICKGHGCKEIYIAEAPSKLNLLMLSGLNDSLNLGEENSLLCKIFQNLTTLEVSSCNKLKSLVSSTVTLQNLTTLEVSKSGGLINLMAISTAKSLVQLARLKIIECKMIEEIIIHGGDREEIPIIFSKLEYLELHCLPRLTSFYTGSYAIEFPSLQKIVVRQCPNMKIFSLGALNTPRLHKLQTKEAEEGFWEGSLNKTMQKLFKDMVGFRGMENLTFSKFPHLKEAWHNQFPVSIFSNLKSLVVGNDCSSLTYVFTPSVALDLVQLQELKLKNCAVLEAIIVIEEEKMMNTLFPNLKTLTLIDLPELTSFCNFAGSAIELPSLSTLFIENCPNMETFISNFTGVEMSTRKDNLHTDIQPLFDEKSNFEKMLSIQMDSEENHHAPIQPLFDERVQLPNLEDLKINNMKNVRKVWHHQLTLVFCKLKVFWIDGCHNLLSVFPSNSLGRLQKLEQLVVSNCKSLEVIFEEIVAEEEDVEAAVFPQLTLLKLADLPKLRIIATSRIYVSRLPMLKTLRMWGCKRLQRLTSEFQSFQENHGQPSITVDKVAFPNLEELSLEWNYIAKESMNENFSGNSCKLKDLVLMRARKEAALCPCFFLYKLPNLERLKVINGVLEEMFICKGHGCKEKYIAKAPSKLNYLRLGGLNDSLNLGEENSLLCKIFQNLTTLEVSNCNKLRALVSSTVTFQNLTTLEVSKSGGLINLMAISTAKSLVQLARLKIMECKMIEEIIIHDGDREETPIIFSKLEYLELHCLPRLTSFYRGSYAIEFPSLQQIVGRQCPNMKFFSHGALSTPSLHKLQTKEAEVGFWEGSLNTTIQKMFKEMDRFRDIENFTVSDFPHLKEVWDKQFLGCYFSNLKSLVVDDKCCSLRYIFTPSVALGLVQLQELKLKNCAVLEAIMVIEEEMMMNTLFPDLKTLKLIDLPELTSFCNFAGSAIELPSLATLCIENCPNMQTFISNFTGADTSTIKDNLHTDIKPLFDEKVRLSNLKFLGLDKVDKLRKVWHHQLASDSFCKLASFGVFNCHNVLNVFPSNMLERLQKLDELWLIKCSSLDEIFDHQASSSGKTQAITATQMRKLVLRDLPKLKHIWDVDSQGLLICQNLIYIEVTDCGSLKSIFPASVGKKLLQLEELWIEKCCTVEEIFAKGEEVDDAVPGFPQLTFLRLAELSKLRSFYPRGHISEWPMLKKLQVWNCDKVEISASNFLRFQVTDGESQHEMPVSQPLLLFDKVPLTNLESLGLDWKWFEKGAFHEKLPEYSCKLNFLIFGGFHKKADICVYCFLHKLPNLEKIQVCGGFFKGLFLCEGLGCEEEHVEEPSYKLSHLRLVDLFDSLHLWEENSLSGKVFQHLAILQVIRCDNLNSLVPSAVSFQNLTTLEVQECNELLDLVAIPTAKSLMQLTKLIVSECKMIEKIIKHEGDEAEDRIIFKKLRNLELRCLPSLTSFYLGSYSTEFPSLQKVVVRECPNMKIFSQGALSTPRLHRLQTTEEEGEGFWEGNLNTTIEHLFIENCQSSKEN